MSVAKLKTHRKGGVTLSLKNAVGITNEKRALPHHRAGSPNQGGDAVADNARLDARLEDNFRDFMLSRPAGRIGLRLLGRPLKLAARNVVKPLLAQMRSDLPAVVEGDWYGNDTVWRMALDLNRVLFFANREGRLTNTPQRRYLSIIDGVVAGEREGPLFPTPKACGVLLAGAHPVLVDLAATAMMGFDWEKIPMLREAVRRDWPLRPLILREFWEAMSNLRTNGGVINSVAPAFQFEACAGWKGHIEIDAASLRP